VCLLLAPIAASAQGTGADYQRANSLRTKYEALALNVPGAATWAEDSSHFWYRRSVKGGHDFVIFDVASKQERPAFDHAKLAASLSAASGTKCEALTLPFNTFTFADGQRSIEFNADGATWRCALADYACRKVDAQQRRGDSATFRSSPDKKWEAVINNYNVAVRPAGSQQSTILSLDGSEGNAYELNSIVWSPDSRKLAAYRGKPGYRREVHYVESSAGQQ